MKYVGIGTRVLNFIVDTLLVFLISYLVFRFNAFYVYYYHSEGMPWYLYFWITMVVYYLLFELIFSRTPGKWLSMSKVVNKAGKRPAIWQILIRSVVRVIPLDCFFIPFIDRTLHDYVSGTAVVEI